MLDTLQFPDAEIALQGAHLTRFRDWLYLSSASHFESGKAIRGGIPVVFPWFGPIKVDPAAPQHGWARTSEWEVELQRRSGTILALRHDDWHIRLAYEFGDTLWARVQVKNQASEARSFEFALHTYFAVSDVSRVEIEGLDGLTYVSKAEGGARKTQSGSVRFPGEVDRVYFDAPSPLTIRDGATGYELRGNWKSAVTWNPGAERAATLADLGADEWRGFVCLEVGAIGEGAVQLAPGETWAMQAETSRF